MNDLVSVIMPSYNTAEYIKESIQSVISQTYENWELIVVDDCSADNTKEVVSAFGDSRIIYVENEKNCGAAVSRNKALRMARGKWIAFLDSDDLWLPEKLEKQIKFMEENGCHFSYTEYKEIDSEGNLLVSRVSGPSRIGKVGMYNYCWPGCLTVMYDADFIGLLEIGNIQKNNDYAMWLKISKITECFLLRETLAKYRRGRSGSISTQRIFLLIKWHYKLFREVENKSVTVSAFNTFRNLFFGFLKKIIYVKK